METLKLKRDRISLPPYNFPPRWEEGELCEVLENDFNKYDFKLKRPNGMIMYFFNQDINWEEQKNEKNS